MNLIKYCTEKKLEYLESGGYRRYLGSHPDRKGLFKALPRFSDHFQVIDKSNWIEINRRSLFDKYFGTFDQNGHGSCVGNGWAMAASKARVLMGMKPVLLSPGWFYGLINGNRDEGAVISDGIEAATTKGFATFATVGQDPIYHSQMPESASAEAERFKLVKCYQVNSFADIITALMMPKPFIPVYGYMVGNNFERFNEYGVAGHDNGPGNHCNHADGIKKLPTGEYVLDDHNSWGAKWGPFGNGRVYINEEHLFGGGDQADCCIIEAPDFDPQDPTIPPDYTPAA